MKIKFKDFINEYNNEYILSFDEVKNTNIKWFKKYTHVIRDMLKNNISKYNKSNSQILKMMVNNSLPLKTREFLDSLISKIGTNNGVFKNVFSDSVKYVLNKTTYTSEEKNEFIKFKNDILQLLEDIKNNKIRIGDVDNINLIKLIYAYRYDIFSFKNMEKAFKIIYNYNIAGLIAEKSVKDFLISKNQNILKTNVENDIKHGIDITTDKTTYQVKMGKNINILNNKIYINNTSMDLYKIKSPSQKYEWLIFVKYNELIFIKRDNILNVKGFKNKGSNFVIELKNSKSFFRYKWTTDYNNNKTGTILDYVFNS